MTYSKLIYSIKKKEINLQRVHNYIIHGCAAFCISYKPRTRDIQVIYLSEELTYLALMYIYPRCQVYKRLIYHELKYFSNNVPSIVKTFGAYFGSFECIKRESTQSWQKITCIFQNPIRIVLWSARISPIRTSSTWGLYR